ncbi:hypothetical protein J2Z37_004747 [Ammoniphilus resinae]|uniref:Uncharacterized protein n=1 Tax=Ammoniphilus resinae TaxID=861532 RepID=A0ABS4GWT5_9BACL|nr:hypothetical protein [Ammoniphilus resinae]
MNELGQWNKRNIVKVLVGEILGYAMRGVPVITPFRYHQQLDKKADIYMNLVFEKNLYFNG